MAKSHNKKRNVGIIYELLLRNISSCLVNENKDHANLGLKIIESRFDQSTELYKEFRLFNALARSTASSTPVVASILSEAKAAARRCDLKLLNKEKSQLIKDINYSLDDPTFYHRRIPEYKIYATIQTLLNDWRKGDLANLNKMIEYEGKVAEWLLSEKNNEPVAKTDEDIDALVVKIMTEKLNKKYSGKLNEDQRILMKLYALRVDDENDDKIRESLKKMHHQTMISLEEFQTSCNNETLLEKFDVVFLKLKSIDLEEKIEESTITKFLTVCELKTQLKEAVDEQK